MKRRTGSLRFTSLAWKISAMMVRTTASMPGSATAAGTPSKIPVKTAVTVLGRPPTATFPERACGVFVEGVQVQDELHYLFSYGHGQATVL
ncbi:hypothetical protein [Pseudarthrobacter sp. AB1]|uniref:hypothetical protein n=1 Tax=Pseudarthrobacter sp. AB1 TaxID=2138309 RepID=UPI00186B81EF|nr:hypothetical protein [Pseudarthrobacter sp. AB1]